MESIKYLNSTIISWIDIIEKEKETIKIIKCHIYRENSLHKPLNLGECNDGSKFQSIKHAINQAKEYVNTCNENNW